MYSLEVQEDCTKKQKARAKGVERPAIAKEDIDMNVMKYIGGTKSSRPR